MKNEGKGSDSNNINYSDNENINNIDNNEANQEGNAQDINYEDLMKQLGILNLSINAVYIVIMATLMNLDFLNHQKGKILDSINNTNLFQEERNIDEEAKMANRLFLYTTCIFLGINLYNLQQLLSVDSDKRDENEIERAKNRVISSILILLATRITTNILNF